MSLLTGGSDEMNGLDARETRRTIERGQQVFADAFGAPASGFLAPAWQRGHVRVGGEGASPFDWRVISCCVLVYALALFYGRLASGVLAKAWETRRRSTPA